MQLYPVILCGGSGTRLWPLSRAEYPKQFMDIGGKSLFKETLTRVLALPQIVEPIIVCNEVHRFYVAAALQEEEVKAKILLEPKGRNTAPAIALAALTALDKDPEAYLLVLPSDHLIEPQNVFNEAVQAALKAAEKGYLLTFGIKPDAAETGFGYIKQGQALEFTDSIANGTGYPASKSFLAKSMCPCFKVEAFIEKPTLDKAEFFLAQDNYFWNSGMFLFKASLYLTELKKFEPDIYTATEKAFKDRSRDIDFIRPKKQAFLSAPAVSIDYAIMEKTKQAAFVPLAINWSDLGSWEAFYKAKPKDKYNNVLIGDVLCREVVNSYFHSTKRLLVGIGLKDIALIETADAVLAADRSRLQDVKYIVEELKAQHRKEFVSHTLVYRPWGSYETLVTGEHFQVKKIIVKPKAQLSLQKHYHRAEHWIVVNGIAEVTVGDEVKLYKADQSTYIPLGIVHRLKNPGIIPLIIIEVQSGAYLGEDDIVRLEDSYGR